MALPAILFSANPNVMKDSRGGEPEEHIKLAVKNGSVNWNLWRNFRRDGPLENYYSKIKHGYIYYVPDGYVSYSCNINWIKRRDLLTSSDLKYFPNWRKSNKRPDIITLNIKKFNRLSTTNLLKCSDFKSYVTGEYFKSQYVNNYLIVEQL